MQTVIFSINRPYTDRILSGKKTVELRTRPPMIEGPYKAIVYETKRNGGCGKIIAEFDAENKETYRFCMGIPWHLVVEGYIEMEIYGRLLEYERNEWAKKHFTTPEEYVSYTTESWITKAEDGSDILQEGWKADKKIREYYRSRLKLDEWGFQTLTENKFQANSNSRFLEDIINPVVSMEDDLRILQKEDILHLIFGLIRKIKQYCLRQCNISMAFREQENETDNVELLLIPCDGIELNFYDQITDSTMSQRWYTSEEELLISTGGCSADSFGLVENLLTTCVDIYQNFDFEHNGLIFCEGW